MFIKSFWKFLLFLLCSIALLAGIYKVAVKFPNFNFDTQTLVSILVSILILLSLVYRFMTIHGIKSTISKLLLWQIIFFGIITGYAFRFELQDASNRVLAVLAPSYNLSNKKGQIMIARSQDGHFYIKALINNLPIKFMIDTGASDIALTKNDALILKFDLSKLKFTKSYLTANGINRAADVILSEFKIGEMVFNNLKAHIGSGDLDISLLGMSALSLFKSFSINGDILILSY